MMRREEIETELQYLESTLAGTGNEQIFTVPAGYFIDLPGTILLQVRLLEVQQEPLYKTPENYFDTLPAIILQRVQATGIPSVEEEINALSPLLAGLRKRPVYTVPDDYFNEPLPIPVAEAQTPAKVVKMSRKRNWIGYAAAAVVTGLMFIAAYKYWPVQNNATNAAVADVNKEVTSLSDEDILGYLNTSSNPANDVIADDNAATEEDYFHLISDKEIQEYLSDNKDPKDRRSSGI
jgi:hypothetical protein